MGRIRNLLVSPFRLPFKYKYVCTSCVKTLQFHKPPYFLHFICQLTQTKKKEKKTEMSVYCLQMHEITFVATVIVLNNCVSPALIFIILIILIFIILIFIIYTHPKIGIQKFRREMDLIGSPSERFKLIFNSAFQRHPVFLSLKNFSISKQLKSWKSRY